MEIILPYNTVNRFEKPDGSYRFVQDLRAINTPIIPIAPVVLDVPSLLSSIPAAIGFFTVFDLKNAFFFFTCG